MVRYAYGFRDGDRDLADLLGGKGANLAEMTRLGLPVPPGFTVTTEACRSFLATGEEPEGLSAEVSGRLSALETVTGRRLGQPDDPLLLSVRSGARFSMPGMMETVLDIGLNDASVLGPAKVSGDERFAWDSYRRLVQMFGSTVMGVDPALFDEAMSLLKETRETSDDPVSSRIRRLYVSTSQARPLASRWRLAVMFARLAAFLRPAGAGPPSVAPPGGTTPTTRPAPTA